MPAHRSLLRKHLQDLNRSDNQQETSRSIPAAPTILATGARSGDQRLAGKSETTGAPTRSGSAIDHWEADLASRFTAIKLVGELNLNRDEFERLARDVSTVISQYGDQRLISRYSCSLATFLVFCGIYGYEQGTFWDSVKRRVGSQVSTPELGNAFIDILADQNLETFPEFDEQRAHLYVSRILAHGGVPDYCLPDFFDLLTYTLNRPGWSSLPVRELIAEWRSRRFSFVQIDVPIQRFLTHGGATARDFLQRSIDMVDAALDGGATIDPVATGLPIRVGEAFNHWLVQRRSQGKEVSRSASQRRFMTPRISIDPWGGEGIVLRLPAQSIDIDARNASWSLGYGAKTRVIDVTQRNGSTTTLDMEIVLEEPASRWDVTFMVDGVEQSTWQFAGLTPQRPVLAFHPDSLEVVRSADAVPSGETVLLCPVGSTLSASSGGLDRPLDILERFPPLWGAWRNFEIIRTTIPDLKAVNVVQPLTGKTASIPILPRESGTGKPVSNIDELRISTVWAGDDRLPVVTRAPSILIPATDGTPISPERWTIVLTPNEGSVPYGRVIRSVGELEWSRDSAGGVVIDFAQPALLDSHALGTFATTVRGPLGRDARFDFAVVPGLDVRGQASHATINRPNGIPAQIEIRTDEPLSIRCLDDDVTRQLNGTLLELSVPGRLTRLAVSPVDIEARAGELHPAVELQIPVAGARWTIVGGSASGQLSWTSQSVSVPQDVVLADQPPGLLVEGYSCGGPSDLTAGIVRLSLRDAAGNQRQGVTVPIKGPRAWVSLGTFSTTISASSDAALRVVLDIIDSAGRVIALEREVLRLTRDLVVTGLRLTDTIRPDGQREVHVDWHQPYQVNDRALCLSSMARPWQAATVIPIPDGPMLSFSFKTDDSQLPPGPYQADIIVVDPWDESPSLGTGAQAFEVQIGTDEEFARRVERPATTSTELLEQFMLAPSAHRLGRLRELLATEDPQPAITVLAALTTTADADVLEDESYLEATILELREALVDHPELFRALADRHASSIAGNNGNSNSESLARIVAGIGLAQADVALVGESLNATPAVERAVLERELPWLFLTRVGDRLMSDDYERTDAEILLGDDALRQILPPLHPGEKRERPWCDRAQDILGSFGHAPELHAYRMPVSQLELIRPSLGLVPAGVMDRDTYVTATFDWLLSLNHPRRVARKQRVEAWLANAVPLIESALHYLVSIQASGQLRACWTGLEIAVQLVNLRETADLQGVELLPFAVGGTALLQRVVARTYSGSVRIGESRLLEYGRFAAWSAPGIYMHDLCLFDLLLTVPAGVSADQDEDEVDGYEGLTLDDEQ